MAYVHPKMSDYIKNKTCPVCEVSYLPDSRSQVYCSTRCRSKAQGARNAASAGKPHWRETGKVCAICATHFMPPTKMSSNAKYCSDACRIEGVRVYQKKFKDRNPGIQAVYNRARETKEGGNSGTLQQRLYKRYPDLPKCCEACGLDEPGILEAAHKPGFGRNGGHMVMKFYERHMFWMLCPNDHTRLDRKLNTPAELGLIH